MPDSNSPYATATAAASGVQTMELLRSQLVSIAEDRRRIMLWSAILALGSLMLLGHVAILPWFLALVPLALLACWHASLVVRQRRYQAAWDSVLQKAEGGAGSASMAKGAALTAASAELGAKDIPALLTAIASPSILLFHGLLLGAVVAGGVTHETHQPLDTNSHSHATKALATTSGGGGGCGCGGGSGGTTAAAATERPSRAPNPLPPRSFSNAPARPPQNPPPTAYPPRPPGVPPAATGRNPLAPQPQPTAAPAPTPQVSPPPSDPITAKPGPRVIPSRRFPTPSPATPASTPTPGTPPIPATTPSQSPSPERETLPLVPSASPVPSPSPAKSAKPVESSS